MLQDDPVAMKLLRSFKTTTLRRVYGSCARAQGANTSSEGGKLPRNSIITITFFLFYFSMNISLCNT